MSRRFAHRRPRPRAARVRRDPAPWVDGPPPAVLHPNWGGGSRRLSTSRFHGMLDLVAAVAFETRLGELEAAFGGQLVRPGASDYDEHRAIWNGSIDRRPELIARCAGTHDVLAALRFAREAGLRIAVRSGGHSFPGLSVADAAVVIDLGSMKGIRVDPQRRIATVQAGARLGDV